MLRLFRLRPDDHVPGLLPIVTSIGLGLGVMSILTLALGLAGVLNRFTAIAVLVGGIALAVVEAVRYGRGRRPGEADAAVRAWFGGSAGWAWLWLAVVPLLAIVAVGAMVPPGFLWTPDEPHGYDVVEYHLQVPRKWYEAGRIVPLGHNVFSFFPFNVEMHYLLAMHLRGGPWSGMYLAQLMHASYVVLAVLAVYAFAPTLSPLGVGRGVRRCGRRLRAVAHAARADRLQRGRAIALRHAGDRVDAVRGQGADRWLRRRQCAGERSPWRGRWRASPAARS